MTNIRQPQTFNNTDSYCMCGPRWWIHIITSGINQNAADYLSPRI